MYIRFVGDVFGGLMKAIFYNGLVYTGEETEKQAFLVEDGLFKAVGSDR